MTKTLGGLALLLLTSAGTAYASEDATAVGALERCLMTAGAPQVTTDYACGEAAYALCETGGALRADCLTPLREALWLDVDAVLATMPQRPPEALGLSRKDYRALKRGLRAGLGWPGCPKGVPEARCDYMTALERWVEARALQQTLTAVTVEGRER
ncbi:hypothetical protein [Tropicibacter naphthalenivorans]|uniref:Secreted protein n=1 Tax=Tropicibacter naphthalenivorans TaxID=441103 RepID=A0A0P1GF20_9RHOB|nr:hypothetical protein [Tropicibacter naphthalenivorans]CUH80252.1 hypothetical protein TRN7648_02895 [Tropicibacter naphthalenivorans]SMC85665.1 hypothetical protein SAMN04488093_105164 [Tropicibacter naphthalenivorans]